MFFLKNFFKAILIYFFSHDNNDFSITNIYPKIVTLGENNSFILSVSNNRKYNNHRIKIANSYLNCINKNILTLECSSIITFSDLNDINNLTKYVTINDSNTNLLVKIDLPKTLKVLNCLKYIYYSYDISHIKIKVNYNSLFNSNITFKIGNITLNNCSKDIESHHYIDCYQKFYNYQNSYDLPLLLNDQDTGLKIDIKTPEVFKEIEDIVKNTYYVSYEPQFIYLRVNSFYNINNHKIVLIPSISTNSNISLSSCQLTNYEMNFIKCFAILNESDIYTIYVDNNNTKINLFVYEIFSTSKIISIYPNKIQASNSEIIFKIKVDFIKKLNETELVLIDEYNNKNIFFLKNCNQILGTTDEINCKGAITKGGKYYIYLNKVKQKQFVFSFNSKINKAYDIEPKILKFNEKSVSSNFKIEFDSIYDLSLKNLIFKSNNKTVNLIIVGLIDYFFYYNATFYEDGLYYLYINNIKQNISVLVTKDESIKKVYEIFPKSVPINTVINYNIKVNNNIDLKNTLIELKRDHFAYKALDCKIDLTNNNNLICKTKLLKPGKYIVYINYKKNLKTFIHAYDIPVLKKISPISFLLTSNPKILLLNFNQNIEKYINKIKLIGPTIIIPKCKIGNSIYVLNCSAIFEKNGIYNIYVDNIFFKKFIFIYTNDNDNYDVIKDNIYNNKYYGKKNDNKNIYYKIIICLFAILFMLVFL